MGGKETSKESSATQKLEENEEPLSIDEVFVWWLESPEISKTIICIRKIPQTTLDISVPSDTTISIVASATLADEEIKEISSTLKMAPEILAYHWGHEPLIRETEITLKFPVVNTAKLEKDCTSFVLVTFDMKKELKLTFK